jgi:two-component system cell cycle sensor histidine kinase/response regulator CckA
MGDGDQRGPEAAQRESTAAEVDLERGLELERGARERLELQFALCSDGLCETRPDGTIALVNARLCEIVAQSRERLLGRHLRDLFAPASLESALLPPQGLAKGEAVASQREVVRGDGTLLPAQVNTGTLSNGNHLMSVRDLSAERSAAREREDLEARLRRAERGEAVGWLAAGIAHDFNNLLTPIVGGAEMLLSAHPPGSAARSECEAILEAGKRAAQLTRQILALGRQELLRVRRVDLNAELLRLQTSVQRLAGERVEVQFVLSPIALYVDADPVLLQEVMTTLTLNARDAMPQGGHLAVRSGLQPIEGDFAARVTGAIWKGPYARIDVEDDGAGMEESRLRTIFDPFFTMTHLGKGTGLRLAALGGIVHQHGGIIFAESAPGHGSTFTVCLPAAPVAAARMDSVRSAPRAVGSELILVAEDEPAVRSVLRRMLDLQGYQVVAAASGEEALDALAGIERAPDLLLADVMMPGIDGHQLARRLREQFPGIKLLLISGFPGAFAAGRCTLEPGAQVLNKPFDHSSLCQAVRSALDGR